MNLIILFTFLTVANTIIQTVKSLCTVRCSTFTSACVNAVAYGLYTFVIFFTTADGMNLWAKAAITAIANFFGVYIANHLFALFFSRTVRWKVEVSIPILEAANFEKALHLKGIEYYNCGYYKDWKSYALFSENKRQSRIIKEVLPKEAKYNIVECVKRL